MIEHVFFGIKIVFLLIGVIQLYRLNLSGLFFVAVPFFITGAELITDSEAPWGFLLSGKASQDDIVMALFGGLGLIGMLIAVCALIWAQVESKKRGGCDD